MFYEPEDTSSGDESESNTIFQLEGDLPTGFNFMASSWSRENGGDSNGVGITPNHISRLPFFARLSLRRILLTIHHR
jgi:hypothetical protein